MNTNQLYYGDNLDILRAHIPDESVDLIYIDPPFNSNQAYNVIFSERDGSSSQAQIQAFEDTWHWVETTEQAYYELVETAPPLLVETIKSFRGILGEKQSDGIPRDDGVAIGGTPPCPETDRELLSPL